MLSSRYRKTRDKRRLLFRDSFVSSAYSSWPPVCLLARSFAIDNVVNIQTTFALPEAQPSARYARYSPYDGRWNGRSSALFVKVEKLPQSADSWRLRKPCARHGVEVILHTVEHDIHFGECAHVLSPQFTNCPHEHVALVAALGAVIVFLHDGHVRVCESFLINTRSGLLPSTIRHPSFRVR